MSRSANQHPPKPPKELHNAQYDKLIKINRVIHLDDYESLLEKKRMISSPLDSFYDNSRWLNNGLSVLWFSPTDNPEVNHYYGNVALQIDFKDVTQHYGSELHLYYIECIEYKTSIYARVLVTRKTEEELVVFGFPPDYFINITESKKDNMPLLYDDNVGYMVATGESNVPYNYGYKFYNVEFMIDCEQEDEEWFFYNCEVIPVNHSEANTGLEETGLYRPYICHKYNNKTSSPKEKCPSPYSTLETKERLKFLNLVN